jgi:hypothetical protein
MLRRKRPGTTKESGIRHASSRRKNCLRSVNTLVNRQLHRLRLGGRHGGRQGLKVPGLGHCVAGFRNSGAENDLGELGQGQIRDHAHPVSEGHEIERPPTRKERSQGQAPIFFDGRLSSPAIYRLRRYILAEHPPNYLEISGTKLNHSGLFFWPFITTVGAEDLQRSEE